jgi:hypothetical protein
MGLARVHNNSVLKGMLIAATADASLIRPAIRGLRRNRDRQDQGTRKEQPSAKRTTEIPDTHDGHKNARRFRENPAVQRRPRLPRQTGMATLLSPEDVPRKLHQGMRARVFQDRATGILCASPPGDPRPKRVGQPIPGNFNIDAKKVHIAHSLVFWSSNQHTQG